MSQLKIPDDLEQSDKDFSRWDITVCMFHQIVPVIYTLFIVYSQKINILIILTGVYTLSWGVHTTPECGSLPFFYGFFVDVTPYVSTGYDAW